MKSILRSLISKLGITIFGARALFVSAVLMLIMSINLYRDYPNIVNVFTTSDFIFFLSITIFATLTGWLGFSKSGISVLRANMAQQERPSTAARISKALFAAGAISTCLLVVVVALLIVAERTDQITEQSILVTLAFFSVICFPFVYKRIK